MAKWRRAAANVVTPSNKRVNALVRPVTALAQNASAAPARPTRYAQRWADEKHREGEGLERGAASPWVARVANARVSGGCPTTLAPVQSRGASGGHAALRTAFVWHGPVSGRMYEATGLEGDGSQHALGGACR
jgi:hypothetical protein